MPSLKQTLLLLAPMLTLHIPTLVHAATCTVNGQITPCPQISDTFGSMLIWFTTAIFSIIILMIVANWKIYQKAGKPGWASIIPIYNVIVLLEIIRKPTWWVVLLFIPLINIVVFIFLQVYLAKAFGKETVFALGLFFLPFIFYPILGFGTAQYRYTLIQEPIIIPPSTTA